MAYPDERHFRGDISHAPSTIFSRESERHYAGGDQIDLFMQAYQMSDHYSTNSA